MITTANLFLWSNFNLYSGARKGAINKNAIKTKAVKSDISDIWPVQWQDGHSEYLARKFWRPLDMGGAGAGPSDWPCNPCIHWPSHSVACLVHTLICIRRQLSAKCWPVFTWNISLCQSGICLKAEVPLAPVSQSIVSKYQSNILYLNGVNMFTRFRGVLWLCTVYWLSTAQRATSFNFDKSVFQFSFQHPIHHPALLSRGTRMLLISQHSLGLNSLQINNLIWYQFTFLSPISLALQVSIHWRFSHLIFCCRRLTDKCWFSLDTETVHIQHMSGWCTAVQMDVICTESVLVLKAIVYDDATPSLVPREGAGWRSVVCNCIQPADNNLEWSGHNAEQDSPAPSHHSDLTLHWRKG